MQAIDAESAIYFHRLCIRFSERYFSSSKQPKLTTLQLQGDKVQIRLGDSMGYLHSFVASKITNSWPGNHAIATLSCMAIAAYQCYQIIQYCLQKMCRVEETALQFGSYAAYN